MKFFSQLYRGLTSYIDGTKFIFKHNLYWYFLAPILLGIGFYMLGGWLEDLATKVTPSGDTMHDLMSSLLEKQFYDGMGYMLKESQKYIAVIFLAPVWAFLSEKVEEILTQNEYPFVLKYFIQDVVRGIRITIWSMVQEYAIFFVWLICSWIMGFPDWTNVVAALVIGFYFYGFGYMDYINERRRLNIAQSVHFIRQNAGLAVGIGIIYSVAFEFIPFGIGLLVAPIAMVGTTIAMSEIVDLKENEYARHKENVAEA